ncbi:vWA domain-containing protein [Sporosarcina ureae]|uniref:vWA domain-containing protein n=1 Tax=Sporosarcina ureae TaxID=1571 RepID=UPI003002A836
MKKGITELVFILDRSGSMSGLESDTIGGYNGMLEKQKKEEGQARVTTILFDDAYELLQDQVDLQAIQSMTSNEYYVRGMTALLDAIGKTILRISHAQKNASDEERARNVLFVITTDGLENASSEFTYDKIRKLIDFHKGEQGWEFIFLGANIDAIATASQFGISQDRATNFHADGDGTELNYDVISETISSFRAHSEIKEGWKERIEEDFNTRSLKSKEDTSIRTINLITPHSNSTIRKEFTMQFKEFLKNNYNLSEKSACDYVSRMNGILDRNIFNGEKQITPIMEHSIEREFKKSKGHYMLALKRYIEFEDQM